MKSDMDDLIWRLRDIRELLLYCGVNGRSMYGIDEWSNPIVNLDLAIKRVEQIKDKGSKDNAKD